MSGARFRFVFFDVDSTLVTVEGIDVLAGGNPEVEQLTAAAMNGDVPLDDVYGRRLAIIRPSLQAVERLGTLYTESLVEGAAETVETLRHAGADVHLVTAAIEQAVLPLARHLGIRQGAVHAVRLRFDETGNYAGFDERSFLTRNGGKELVVRSVLARSKGSSAFIGDGVSDLETRTAVDLFIGFGGVHTRPRVKDNADVFVEGPSLRAILPHLMEEVR
jgi:phosphoserine phosphatase